MTYTVTNLITGAYYASGIVAREFQTIDGDQLNDGLLFLNDILGEKRVDNAMIPYNTEYSFTTVAGQETYLIPSLIEVDTMVFFLDTVRYQMTQIPRNQYFGTSRAENIQSLPLSFHVERVKGGANVSLYFLPNQVYTMTLHGLFDLSEVTLNQDLSASLDRFYITYLRYALAQRVCVEFDYDVPPGVAKVLNKYENEIANRSQQLDLRMTKTSTLGRNNSLNYAQINLGGAWTVSGGW